MELFKKKAGKEKSDLPVAGGEASKGRDASVDAPWVRAGLQHNDTFLRLAAQVKNWRLYAFCSMGVAAISVIGMAYVGSQSKFIPMLVEVDKLGHTLAVRAVTGDAAVTDSSRLVYREMFDLIENLRTVTTDRQIGRASCRERV